MTDEMDVATEDFGGDAGFEDAAEVTADVDASDSGGDWSWVEAEGLTPDEVRKRSTKFTQEWQKVKEMEKQYEQYKQLEEEIRTNPDLQTHLRKFYENGPDEKLQLETLKNEIMAVKNDIGIKEELVELNSYVSDEGLPEFEQRELLEYAARGGYPDLRSAYQSLKFDEIRQASEEDAYDKIKKTRGAAIPKVSDSDKRKPNQYTEQDLRTMSDEDFIANYANIAKSMQRGM